VWFINNTKTGLQMRAIAEDLQGATLQGINIHRISAIATVIACGSAAVAGGLLGNYLGLSPTMGDEALAKALILVILGGLGSMTGIFYAGLLLGAMDAILPLYFNGPIYEVISMGVVIIILLIRPKGFLGREMEG
jgi:branched-subunit amino acid ABC-type transport system permease component